MRWFNERRADALTWTGGLTPTMEAKWNIALALGENLLISPTNQEGTYEVSAEDSVVVKKKTFLFYYNII